MKKFNKEEWELHFDAETHKYWRTHKVTGESVDLISVTTLLKKHKLVPDYSYVKKETLNKSADYGQLVHAEIEEYIKTGTVGFSEELERFIEICETRNIYPQKSEFIVWNDIVAGTVDMLALTDANLKMLSDFKTTSLYHKHAVAWQLSIYNYLSDEKADILSCIHFKSTEPFKIVNAVSVENVEELLNAEREGRIYGENAVKTISEEEKALYDIQLNLAELKAQKEALENAEAQLKEFFIAKMEQSNIKSIENDYFKITYTAPTTRESVDTKLLKETAPEIFEQFKKISDVKASVRITLRKGDKSND